MKYLFIFLISIMTTSLVAQKKAYYGWNDINMCYIYINQNDIKLLCTNGVGCAQRPDMVKNDTLFFNYLRLYVTTGHHSFVDTIINNAKLLQSEDSISVLGTKYIFYSESEMDKLVNEKSIKPFNFWNPCSCNAQDYQLKRLHGQYKIDKSLMKTKKIKVKPAQENIEIKILTDSTGYILHKNKKNYFTFKIKDCCIQILTIEKACDVLNLHNGYVIFYSYDRLYFKNIAFFVNESRELKWKLPQ